LAFLALMIRRSTPRQVMVTTQARPSSIHL
jgi:hypothetical protein